MSEREQSEREIVRRDLFHKFKSRKGVGEATAQKCADSVIEYLDSLVHNNSDTGEPKPGERDKDGIECIKRPKGTPSKYNYLYWEYSSNFTMGWLHPEKPLTFNPAFNHYTCKGLDEGDEDFVTRNLLYDILGEARVESEPASDRIVRLVD